MILRAGREPGRMVSKQGFSANHLSNSENHSCMKFLAQDFNRPKLVVCFKIVNYEAILKNGINARLLSKPTQQAVIVFRGNVDQYFHGVRTINRLDSVSH